MSKLQSELENRTNRYQDDSVSDTRAAEEQVGRLYEKRITDYHLVKYLLLVLIYMSAFSTSPGHAQSTACIITLV